MPVAEIPAHIARLKQHRLLALFLLVVIADILLFGRSPGINLFVLQLSTGVAILLLAWGRPAFRATVNATGLSALAGLPLVEAPSLTGVAVAISAVTVTALVAAGLFPAALTELPGTVARLFAAIPGRLLKGLGRAVAPRTVSLSRCAIWRQVRGWIMPLAMASVFLCLFASANPLIEQALEYVDLAMLLSFLDLRRAGFWLVSAGCLRLLLRPRLRRRRITRTVAIDARRESLAFGETPLLRSLLLFNGLFAVQTAMDLAYLWGGASLPAGMSHAEYAHRGAYPLVVTALLAAIFVLVAMRKEGVGPKAGRIRRLVYLWICQNVLLCISAILRLDLYVEVYSLTLLRLAAGIWMGLVAAGLGLIMLSITWRKSNAWLVSTNLSLLLAVFYGTACTDVSAVVARFNVVHSALFDADGRELDLNYMRYLGPSAIPALDLYLARFTFEDTENQRFRLAETLSLRADLSWQAGRDRVGWREWSYRSFRLRQYLDGRAAVEILRNLPHNSLMEQRSEW